MRNDDYSELYGEDSERTPGELYEEVYDEEGDEVVCDLCDGRMEWNNNEFDKAICSKCERVMGRYELFNHVGANPPGKECVTCYIQPYPLCRDCPQGYEPDYKG